MADITIRKATVEDSESIARLVSDLGYQTSAVQMRRRLDAIVRNGDYDTFLACNNGEILGFIGTRIGPLYEGDEPYGQIMALAVTRDHQRHGIGRVLIETAESNLVERGARVLVVTSGNQRAHAHAFYEKCGYRFTGRRYKKAVP